MIHAPYMIATLSKPRVHGAVTDELGTLVSIEGTLSECPVLTDLGEGQQGRLLLHMDSDAARELIWQLTHKWLEVSTR
jgi:hypothetical protein